MSGPGAGPEDDRYAAGDTVGDGSVPVSRTTIRYCGACSIEIPARRDSNSRAMATVSRDAVLLPLEPPERLVPGDPYCVA